MIPLSSVDELVRQACTALAQQWYGEHATVKLVPRPPTYLARVVVGTLTADGQAGAAHEEVTGNTPRQALDGLLARLQRANGVERG